MWEKCQILVPAPMTAPSSTYELGGQNKAGEVFLHLFGAGQVRFSGLEDFQNPEASTPSVLGLVLCKTQ